MIELSNFNLSGILVHGVMDRFDPLDESGIFEIAEGKRIKQVPLAFHEIDDFGRSPLFTAAEPGAFDTFQGYPFVQDHPSRGLIFTDGDVSVLVVWNFEVTSLVSVFFGKLSWKEKFLPHVFDAKSEEKYLILRQPEDTNAIVNRICGAFEGLQ